VTQAQNCLEVLTRKGFLTWDNRLLAFQRTDMKIRFPTTKSHPSIRKFHQAMIKKAFEELKKTEHVDFEQRLITGISVTGDPRKLAEAKDILNKALYKAAEVLLDSENPTQVYQMNVQMFRITK
jgi:hypothetical protein